MKIEYTENGAKYFDIHGEEIHCGDTVFMNGIEETVYPIPSGNIYDAYLGTVIPSWIESGSAFRCQFDVYPFNADDEPVLVKRRVEVGYD